jgi:EpsI family protein
LIAVAIAAYWPTCQALWDYWTDLLFGGHGIFVAALAVWLLYRARDRIALARVHSQPAVLVPLVVCSIASLIFWRAGIQSLQLLLWPVLILLAVLAAFGAAVTRAIAVPVCFLYFAMPAWNVLAQPLQSLTIRAVSLLAPAIGVPATISGDLIYLSGDMSFSVELACSGVGFFVEGLAVAALLGELEQAPLGRRLRLLGSMVLVALVTNWIRVLTIVQVGYSTQMRHVLVTRYHVLFGSALFIAVLVLFMWLATRAKLPAMPEATPSASPSRPQTSLYPAAVAALAAAPILVGILAWLPGNHAAARELRLPPGRAEWRGPLEAPDRSPQPRFSGPQEVLRGTYRDARGHDIEAVAISYGPRGRELIDPSNSLMGGGELSGHSAVVVEDGGSRYREELAVDSHGQHSLIWSFYDIGGRAFVTARFAQLWFGVRALGRPPDSALFAFSCACATSCAEARNTLGEFLRAMRPQLPTRPDGL